MFYHISETRKKFHSRVLRWSSVEASAYVGAMILGMHFDCRVEALTYIFIIKTWLERNYGYFPKG